MALYEYRCLNCEKKIEIIKSMSAPDPEKCEYCGGQLKKLLFPSGIILKGSGFYHTEYGSGKEIARRDQNERETGAVSMGKVGSKKSEENGKSSPTSSEGIKKSDNSKETKTANEKKSSKVG